MHKLLVHASRLTLSLFSARPPLSIRRCFTADRTSHQTPHGMRLAAPCKVNEHDQVRSPERLANAFTPAAPRIHIVRPVRVLRLREGASERLAIVGRMADVCAELDRLAARESLCG